MYSQDMQDTFCAKIDRNYADFVREWLRMEPTLLIQEAEEIAATKLVYDELTSSSYSAEHLEPLLRFDNPLEVVRDAWNAGLGFSKGPDMVCIFGNIASDKDIERKYALDDTFAESEQDSQSIAMA